MGKAPSSADSVTHPSGNPANWTPIMVLVDAPPGSLGGVDYAYNMLKLLLAHMSATGIQILGLSVFVSFAFTMLFCSIVGINKASTPHAKLGLLGASLSYEVHMFCAAHIVPFPGHGPPQAPLCSISPHRADSFDLSRKFCGACIINWAAQKLPMARFSRC